jgi:hypothetical protein
MLEIEVTIEPRLLDDLQAAGSVMTTGAGNVQLALKFRYFLWAKLINGHGARQ